MSRYFSLGFISLLFLIVIIPFSLSDPSFSSGPSVVPATNITTSSTFTCDFTALGNGTITANVSWFKNSVFAGLSNSYTLVNNTPNSLLQVSAFTALKGESWYCNVTLSDDNATISPVVSSSITVLNSAPIITSPVGPIVWYEDSAYNSFATASDPDSDTITFWSSIDLNFSPALFTIDSSTGEISFLVTDESGTGNHTMSIFARDSSIWGGLDVVFDIRPVNDAPVLTTTSLASPCIESSLCSFTLLASDEESDDVYFYSNESFINLNSSTGVFSFTPVFANAGNTSINITVVDEHGANTSSIFTLEVTAINKIPAITYQNLSPSSLLQNSPLDINYTINVLDNDTDDTIGFVFSPICDLDNPWIGTLVSNGSGSTNATFVISKNFSVTDNNSFVVCRDITITYFDVGDGVNKSFNDVNISMNITNENDYPYIHQYANFSENLDQYDMHNLSVAINRPFNFTVNGSDIDDLTYEGEDFSYSIYGGSSSLFTINSTSGLISLISVLNESYVGNLSFFVNITDDEGLYFVESFNLTVINNSAPILDTFDYSSCVEDVLCQKTISVYDIDSNLDNYSSFSLQIFRPQLNSSGDIVYNNSRVENYTKSYILSNFISYVSFDSSRTNYSIDFTPDNEDVGFYNFTISFLDDFGSTLIEYVYFNVTNVNDAPVFDDDADNSSIDPLVFSSVVQDLLFEEIFYVYDADMYYGLDFVNVSFNLTSDNISNSSISLVQINSTAFNLSFTPNSSNLGDHQINLTVTDNNSASFTQSINFSVVLPGLSPVIDDVSPSGSPSVLEGASLNFNVEAHDDTPGDSLTVNWYKDDVLVDTLPYSPIDSSTDIYFDYFDAGTVVVRVDVVDLNFNVVNNTWNVTVTNVNRNPVFNYDIQDLSAANNRSISGPTQYYDFFDLHDSSNYVFFDADDDLDSNSILDLDETSNLAFSASNSSSCLSLASFTFSGESIIISPSQIGTCYVNFTATDSSGASVVSNTIRVDILDTQSDSQTQTSSSSSGSTTQTETINVPFNRDVDVPTEFDIIVPGVANIYPNGTVFIPLKLRNTWGDTLSEIYLSANSSYEFQTFEFSQTFFPVLANGDEVDFNMTMADYRVDAPFEVNISAYVTSEDYTDTISIFVNALERGSEDTSSLKSRISFARDLLNDNPECSELNELLNEAEEKSQTDSISALEVLNSVINSCKYLVNEAKSQENFTPKSFLSRLDLHPGSYVNFSMLAIVISVLFVGAILIGVLSKFRLKNI